MIGVIGLLSIVAVAAALLVAGVTAGLRPLMAGRLRGHAVHGRPAILEAVLAGPLLALGLVPVLCVLPWFASLVVPALDHCLAHDEHALHLCFTHLPAVSNGIVGAGGAALLGLVAVLLGSATWRGYRSSRVAARLAGLGDPGDDGAVAVLDTDLCLAFTLGLFHPRVYVSQGLRRRISPSHWAMVLSHERAHARRRDPFRGLVLRAASMLHVPAVRRELLDLHELAVERACDEAAVAENGEDRVSAAEALLALERLATPRPTGAFAAAAAHLEVRVRALLEEPCRPRSVTATRTALAFAGGCLVVASPVHHLVEHVLESWLY